MTAIFPSEGWLKGLETKLNSDRRYGAIAKNWEGDLFFVIEPAGIRKEQLSLYLDLWHGKCREVEFQPPPESYPTPTFTLPSSYANITEILAGNLNAVTAMLTSKRKVKGNMSYILRNMPTVLDFIVARAR